MCIAYAVPEAPYGSWASPITPTSSPRPVRRGGASIVRSRRRRACTGSNRGRTRAAPSSSSSRGTESPRTSFPPASTSATASTSTAAARTGATAPRSSSRTSTTSASTAWTRADAEPRPITPEPPEPRSLRYADGIVVDGTIVCVRERHEGEVVNELVVAAGGRLVRAGDHRRRARLLLLAHDQPGRHAARLPELGPPTPAVDRHRPVGRGDRPASRATSPGGPERVDLPARSGAPTACCISSPTARAGGTSTASATGGRGGRAGRGGARLDAVGVRDVQLRLPARRADRLHPQPGARQAVDVHRGRRVRRSGVAVRLGRAPDAARSRKQAHLDLPRSATRSPVAPAPRRAERRARGAAEQRSAASTTRTSRPRSRSSSRRTRAATALRLLLPAHESGVHRPGGREAAARGQRATAGRPRRASPAPSLASSSPGPAAASPWWT